MLPSKPGGLHRGPRRTERRCNGSASRKRRTRSWLLTGVLVACTNAFLSVAPARALDPPPAASFAGVVGEVASALREARRIAAVLGIVPAVTAAEQACSDLGAQKGCVLGEGDGCTASLVGIFEALRNRRSNLSARGIAAADVIAADVFDAASRLSLVRAALARGDCEQISIPGAHPTHMLLGPDGRSILVRPLIALRGGRRYAVIAQGIDTTTVRQLRETLVPKAAGAGLAIPTGAFVEPVERDLPGDAGGISTARLASFLARLEREAAVMPGLGPFAGVRVTLAEPLRSEQIGKLQLAFVPAKQAPPEVTLGVFTTLDARAGLLADRERLTSLACESSAVEVSAAATLGATLPHVSRLLHGRYRSLAVVGDGREGPLGVASADATPIEVPYLLALPHDFGPDTPLVLAVDGHAGSAARILGKHANGLTERGMAVLAIELPAHGERAVAGADFLDALDPAALGRNVRQAAVDVLAVVQAVTRCGLGLPDGERLRARKVRYLGYSLGGMIGAIVRSVEPAVGASVLVAPGGDILGWLLLRVSPSLGGTYVTCLGGPEDGQSCIPTGKCDPPGACMVDPYLDRLHWLIALPYALAAAAADPLSYVTHRTGLVSRGPLLAITGGEDAALHPALATRLADALGMHPVAPHRRRGPRSQMVQWPSLGHELVDRVGVRAQITEFLASDGRSLMLAEEPASFRVPAWYEVYGASRK